jgi:hypothetical protein
VLLFVGNLLAAVPLKPSLRLGDGLVFLLEITILQGDRRYHVLQGKINFTECAWQLSACPG